MRQKGGGSEAKYTIKVYCGNNPEIKLGNYTALDFIYQGALAFKNYCENNSDNQIAVDIYSSGQLGSTQEATQQAMQGTLECVMSGDGELSTLYPDLQTMSIPYLFDNRAQFYAMQDSNYMESVALDIENKLGLITLAASDNGGFRNFSNNVKPIHSAADMKNLKIRTMESPIYSAMLESFGASATPISYSEMYSALQTGVVDGQENSPGTTLNAGIYEVNKYYVLDGHSIASIFLMMNKNYFENLPDDLQSVVVEAGKTAQYAMRGANCANEALALEALAEKGMEVYAPTAEEKETFRVCQEPVIEWLKGQIGEETVTQFMSAVETVKAGEDTDVSQTVQAASTNTGSMNTITYAACLVAVFAVLFGAWTLKKDDKKKKE